MKATTRFKLAGGAFASLLVLSWVAYWIAFYTIEPSFNVTATRQANGSYRFDISPNFIVRTVGAISIVGPNGIVAEREMAAAGAQVLYVASGLTSNDTVTIQCGLQYDRVAPSFTTKTKSLVVR